MIKLQVEFNCPQKLTDMKSVGDQIYCQSCDKIVHDLSNLNSQDILDFFANNRKACTSVPYDFIDFKIKKIVRFVAAAFLVFGASLFSIEGQSQIVSNSNQQECLEDNKFMIKGQICDTTGTPLAFVNVYLKDFQGKTRSTFTDFDGLYHISLKNEDSFDMNNFKLELSYIGFIGVSMIFDENNNQRIVRNFRLTQKETFHHNIVGVISVRHRCSDGPAVIEEDQLNDVLRK